MNCSPDQAIAVWMQLEDALRDEHHYGGTVAEVYLYLVQGRHPYLDGLQGGAPSEDSIFREEWYLRERQTIRTIYEICKLFARKREAMISWERRDEDTQEAYFCILNWNGSDDWIYDYGHRLHIQVEPQ